MSPVVELPEHNVTVKFPDDMTEQEMQQAIELEFYQTPGPEAFQPEPPPEPSPMEREPAFEDVPVGEPRHMGAVITAPFVPGQVVARSPGAFTEAEPFEIEREEASIADLSGRGVKAAVLPAERATRTLLGEPQLSPEEMEAVGQVAEDIGRIGAELGMGWAGASMLLRVGGGLAQEIGQLYRMLTIPERQAVVVSLERMIAANPEMTEAQIIRRWGSESLYQQALARRAVGPEAKVPPEAAPPTPPEPVRMELPGHPGFTLPGEYSPYSAEFSRALLDGRINMLDDPLHPGFVVAGPLDSFSPEFAKILQQGTVRKLPPGQGFIVDLPAEPPEPPEPGTFEPGEPTPESVVTPEPTISGQEARDMLAAAGPLGTLRKEPPVPTKGRKKVRKAKTLLGAIRMNGGIWDPSLKGEVKDLLESLGPGWLDKETGMGLDEMATALQEDQWMAPFDDDPSATLLALLEHEAKALVAKRHPALYPGGVPRVPTPDQVGGTAEVDLGPEEPLHDEAAGPLQVYEQLLTDNAGDEVARKALQKEFLEDYPELKNELKAVDERVAKYFPPGRTVDDAFEATIGRRMDEAAKAARRKAIEREAEVVEVEAEELPPARTKEQIEAAKRKVIEEVEKEPEPVAELQPPEGWTVKKRGKKFEIRRPDGSLFGFRKTRADAVDYAETAAGMAAEEPVAEPELSEDAQAVADIIEGETPKRISGFIDDNGFLVRIGKAPKGNFTFYRTKDPKNLGKRVMMRKEKGVDGKRYWDTPAEAQVALETFAEGKGWETVFPGEELDKITARPKPEQEPTVIEKRIAEAKAVTEERKYTREVLERSPQLSVGNFLRDLRKERPGVPTKELQGDAKIRQAQMIDRLLELPDEEVAKMLSAGTKTMQAEWEARRKVEARDIGVTTEMFPEEVKGQADLFAEGPAEEVPAEPVEEAPATVAESLEVSEKIASAKTNEKFIGQIETYLKDKAPKTAAQINSALKFDNSKPYLERGVEEGRLVQEFDKGGTPVYSAADDVPGGVLHPQGVLEKVSSFPEYKGRKITEVAIDGAALLVDPADYDAWLDMVRFNVGDANADKIDKAARLLHDKWLKRTDGVLEKVVDFYKEGKGHIGWYDRSKAYIESKYGDDADIFSQFLAITSAGMKTTTNTTLARNAYRQWKRGDREFNNFRHGMKVNLQKAARGEPWYDKLYRPGRPGQIEPVYRKTGNFYKALRGDESAVVVDLWVRKAHGYDMDTRLAAADYDFMESNIRQIARQQGVTPRDVQESIWMGAKLGAEGPGADIRDYGQLLRDILGDESGQWKIWEKAVKEGDTEKARRTLESMTKEAMEPTEAQLDQASTKYLETGKMKDFRDAVPGSYEAAPKPDPQEQIPFIAPDLPPPTDLAHQEALKGFSKEIEGFKDISRTAERTQDPIRLFQTMDQGYSGSKKHKRGPFQRYGSWPARRTEVARMKFVDKNFDAIAREMDALDIHSLKKKKAAFQVAQHVDNKNAWDKDVDSILKIGGVKKALQKFNPKVRRQIVEFAQFYRRTATILRAQDNAMRKKQGRPEIKWRNRYVTKQMRNLNIAEALFRYVGEKKDLISKPGAVDIYGAQKPPEAAYFPHELPQGMKEYPREENLVKLLADYAVAVSRDIYDTNIIQHYKALAAEAREQGLTNTANAIETHAAEVYGGVTTPFTREMRNIVGERPEIWLRGIRKRLNRAVFPFNWTWNLGVQTSSSALTQLRYGTLRMVQGMEYFVNPEMHRWVKNNAYSSIVKSRWGGGMAYQDVADSIVKNRRLQGTKMDTFDQWMNVITSTIEDALTGQAIVAAYHEGKKLGLEGRALAEFASEGGAKTQSMYHYGGVPGLLRDPYVKGLFPFQTFFFEVKSTIQEVVPDTIAIFTGRAGAYETIAASSAEGKAELRRRVWKLARFWAYFTAFNMVADKAFGRKPWQWYSPIPMAALFGLGIRRMSPFMPIQYGIDFSRGIKDVLKWDDYSKLINWTLRYHFYAGVQLSRILRGIEAVAKGKHQYDVRGHSYPVTGTMEEIKAITMGPEGTKEGRERTKKRKESKEILEYKEVAPGVRVPVGIKKGKKAGSGGRSRRSRSRRRAR